MFGDSGTSATLRVRERHTEVVDPSLLVDGGLGSSTQQPKDEALEAVDVLATTTGRVVIESRAVRAVRASGQASELDIVRLGAARYLRHAMSWFAWLASGCSHSPMLPQSRAAETRGAPRSRVQPDGQRSALNVFIA